GRGREDEAARAGGVAWLVALGGPGLRDARDVLLVPLPERAVLSAGDRLGGGHRAVERRLGIVDLEDVVGVDGAEDLVAATEGDVRRLDVGEVGEAREALLRHLPPADHLGAASVPRDGDDAAIDAVLPGRHPAR